MPETLIVNRTSLDTQAAIERVHAFQLSQWPFLATVDGYLGSGTWIACDGGLGLLALHLYRDGASADAGLQVIAGHLLTPSGTASGSSPVDTIRTQTLEVSGQLGADILSAPYLSMTVRIAEPGHQAHLLQALRDVLMECASIGGFTGYRIGFSESLKEELVSLAGWTSREAFLKSVPTGIVPSVRCFKLAWSTTEAQAT
jgi:hypothetical protein